jgi:hypothetical protein
MAHAKRESDPERPGRVKTTQIKDALFKEHEGRFVKGFRIIDSLAGRANTRRLTALRVQNPDLHPKANFLARAAIRDTGPQDPELPLELLLQEHELILRNTHFPGTTEVHSGAVREMGDEGSAIYLPWVDCFWHEGESKSNWQLRFGILPPKNYMPAIRMSSRHLPNDTAVANLLFALPPEGARRL